MKYLCNVDGGEELAIDYVESPEEAAAEYVEDGGDWGESEGTVWVHVSVAEVPDGFSRRKGDRGSLEWNSHTIAIDPPEPGCAEGKEHSWESPYEVLGGIKENPGVWGNGGGVIIKEVCSHCGQYRVTDTWAQDPETGEQGLRSVKYLEADEESRRWLKSQAITVEMDSSREEAQTEEG